MEEGFGKQKTCGSRYLWELTFPELREATLAFIETAKLAAGSILGVYDIYEAITGEWLKAKKHAPCFGKTAHGH